jgi:hypothetical protein
MKIICTSNLGTSLGNSLSQLKGYSPDSRFDLLKIGCTYTVYAIMMSHSHLWYYIYERDDKLYPIAYPAPLFDLIDGTFPPFWVMSVIRHERSSVSTPVLYVPFISHRLWVGDETIYKRLLDDDNEAVRIFETIRKETDASTI